MGTAERCNFACCSAHRARAVKRAAWHYHTSQRMSSDQGHTQSASDGVTAFHAKPGIACALAGTMCNTMRTQVA